MMKTLWKCFCGKPSVQVDSWFNWYPCKDHAHLTPNEYKDAAETAKQEEEALERMSRMLEEPN